MKKSTPLILIFGLAAFAHAALAQDRVFYFGGSLGKTEAKVDACSGATLPCDRKDQNWGLQAGLEFDRNFGAEIGYRDLGKVTEQNDNAGMVASVKTKLVEAVGIAALPIERVSLYGKGGVYGARSVLTSNFLTSGSGKNTNWTYGVGVRYDVLRHFGVRLEWQRYNNLGGNTVGFRSDVNTLSLGAVFRF